MNKLLGIGIATLALALLTTAVFAQGGSGAATASAGVYPCNDNSQCSGETPVCVSGVCTAKTCGVSASDFGFGNLYPGGTVGADASIKSTVHNTGNTPTTSLTIKGTDWHGVTYNAANMMAVGSTSWSVGSGWNPLTNIDANTDGNVGPDLTVYFELTAPTNTPNDNYAQTVTFTGSC